MGWRFNDTVVTRAVTKHQSTRHDPARRRAASRRLLCPRRNAAMKNFEKRRRTDGRTDSQLSGGLVIDRFLSVLAALSSCTESADAHRRILMQFPPPAVARSVRVPPPPPPPAPLTMSTNTRFCRSPRSACCVVRDRLNGVKRDPSTLTQ